MKICNPYLILALASVTTVACAQSAAPGFDQVDADQDGVVSTKEARAALPNIIIVDNNKDGMLNKAEAETAIPGLVYSEDTTDGTNTLIGAEDYQLLVQALAKQEKKSNS